MGLQLQFFSRIDEVPYRHPQGVDYAYKLSMSVRVSTPLSKRKFGSQARLRTYDETMRYDETATSRSCSTPLMKYTALVSHPQGLMHRFVWSPEDILNIFPAKCTET